MQNTMGFYEENWLGKIDKFDPHRLFEPMSPDSPYLDRFAGEEKDPLGPRNPYIGQWDIENGQILPVDTSLRRFHKLM